MNVDGTTDRKSKVNLREGPSSGSPVEKILAPGSKIRFIERTPDGSWTRVYAVEVGVEGWIYSRYAVWEEPPVAGRAVIPLLSVNKVHSWPTYNIDLAGEYDRRTGLLSSGMWLIKNRKVNPADVWAGRAKTYPFGVAGTGEYHGAVDIVPEPRGSNAVVRAAFPGKVVLKRSMGDHNGIILTWTAEGNVSFLTIYRHLGPEMDVRAGGEVDAGEHLGRLGEWAGTQHLHAEVISAAPIPGVDQEWGVPCASAQTANSQFKDALFAKWVKLPYYMYNLIAVVDWFNGFEQTVDIATKVKEIIAEQLGVTPEQVTPEASFIEDLGADSVDIVELVMAAEEEFDIHIPNEEADKIITVQQAIDYITAKKG